MKLILLILSLVSPANSEFKLQNGDLIFQEDCSAKTDNTIKEVTSSIGDYRFIHVGIVYIDEKGETYVIEATRPKVAVTLLNEYLYPKDSRECFPPRSVVGRLKNEYQSLIPVAIDEAMKLVGKDYDDGFILDNDKYYCSELIYDILLKANKAKPCFH